MRIFLLILTLFLPIWAQTEEEFKLTCGKKIPSNRIIGGVESPSDKWPWMILFKYHSADTPDDHYGCGGTIIAERWILTAAHCLHRNAVVEYIIFQTVNPNEKSPEKTVHAKSIIYHEQFQVFDGNAESKNDIGLIELEYPIGQSHGQHVNPICLPSANSTIPEDGQVIATGFGAWNNRSIANNINGGGTTPLLETVFPLIPRDVCSKRLRGNMRLKTILDIQLCGGSHGHGTAPGDSGGPLLMKTENGQWYHVGITSFGNNSIAGLHQQDVLPGVYTNVNKYCDWIEEKTRGEARCWDVELRDATS